MSRYVEKIITQIRKETENIDFAEGIGIDDKEFLQYLNDAQYHLQGLIVAQHTQIFLEEEVSSLPAGQSTVSLPENIYLDNKVHHIEYSPTGLETDYYTLTEVSFKRKSRSEGSPRHYVRYSGKVDISPLPSTSGSLRIIYTKKVPELDLRRGEIIVVDQTATTLTSIGLNISERTYDLYLADNNDYISIVDRDGVIKGSKLNILDDFNVANGKIIFDPTITLEEGVTIEVGDYVVGGAFSTSHSQLPESVERYLIAYSAWKILRRDSSVDSKEMLSELKIIAQEILSSYALMSDDLQYIPQLTDWIDWSSD